MTDAEKVELAIKALEEFELIILSIREDVRWLAENHREGHGEFNDVIERCLERLS